MTIGPPVGTREDDELEGIMADISGEEDVSMTMGDGVGETVLEVEGPAPGVDSCDDLLDEDDDRREFHIEVDGKRHTPEPGSSF